MDYIDEPIVLSELAQTAIMVAPYIDKTRVGDLEAFLLDYEAMPRDEYDPIDVITVRSGHRIRDIVDIRCVEKCRKILELDKDKEMTIRDMHGRVIYNYSVYDQ